MYSSYSSDDELPAAPGKSLPKDRTRDTDVLLRRLLGCIDVWMARALTTGGGGLVGTVETLDDLTNRRQALVNPVVNRVRDILDIVHATLDNETLPIGSNLQKVLFSIAARPPFRALVNCPRVLASVNTLLTLMTNWLAMSPSGMLRLTPPYFLLTGEWRVDYAEHCGFAFILQQVQEGLVSTLPEGVVITLPSLLPAERQKEQFRYVGYALIDTALVSASAGTPDVTPM